MKAVGDEKVCSTCRALLPVGDFHRNRSKPDGLHTDCKPCVSEFNRRWRAANPDKKRAQKKRYDRKHDLMRNYGLTPEQYETMLATQSGACRICERPSVQTLAVDHCHITGRVRGLLCVSCNLGLGNFRDDTGFLARAIEYLGE